MMRRKIERDLDEWKEDPNHKTLVVLGCRQVGKTYSITEFIERSYESYISVNLEKQTTVREAFSGDLDASTIIDNLIIITGKELIPGRSAIFIDEVQASRNAYSSLKWLAEDGRFDIIASGSLLGTTLQGHTDKDEDDDPDGHEPISPLGYVDVLTMYPMDFEEYLWAMGVDQRLIDSVKGSLTALTRIDDMFNHVLEEHFRRYMIVGGMPEAVATYAETKDYVRTRKVIGDILLILRNDAMQYSPKADRLKILACVGSIPSQLASEKRRFQYTDIEKQKGAGSRMYGSALAWLVNSGFIYECHNLRGVDPPLAQNLDEESFKVYACDTGLLIGMMDDAVPGEIVASDPFSNKGIVMENAVAAALAKKKYPLYYYAKKNSTLEIDFVTESSSVDLIEVKSGRNKRSKSLNAMLSEKNRNRRGFKICEGNIETDRNGAVHLPIYAASFLPESAPPEILPVTGPTEEEIERRLRDHDRKERSDAFKSDRPLRDGEAPSGGIGS